MTHTRASTTTIMVDARATVRMRLISIRFVVWPFGCLGAKLNPSSEKDVSLVGKNVSNLGILQGKGKKNTAEASFGGLSGG